MKDLSVQQGVDNTDGDFANGKLVDLQTLVGEGINQDIVQFFQNLADLAGIVFNGLSDNDANGYQTVEALETVVRSFAASTILKGTSERATQTEVNSRDATRHVTGETLGGNLDSFLLAGFKVERVDFTGWDMNTTSSINVPYTLPAGKRIAFIDATIFRDSDPGTKYRKLTSYSINLNNGSVNGGVVEFGGALGNNISLYRTTSGDFDSANFDTVNGSCYIFLEDIP